MGAGRLLVLSAAVLSAVGCGDFQRRSWRTYSNGWYEYAFAYPPEASLSYGGQLLISGTTLDHLVRISSGDRPACQVSVSLGTPERLEAEAGVQRKRPVTFRGVRWQKATYAGNTSSEPRGTLWAASQEPFTYTVSALRGQEPVCQAILSTFRFGVDHGVASAAEASIVKRVARAYAAVHVPGKEFVGGVFVEPAGQTDAKERRSSEALLHVAPRAIVDFAARDQDYRGRVSISMEKTGGTWKAL